MPNPTSQLGSTRPRTPRVWTRTLGLVVALVTLVGSATSFAQEGGDDAPAIAAGGFDRPERLAALDGVFGTAVATASRAGDGPIFYWQDQNGLVGRAATGGTVERVVDSLGVRGVWAAEADGAPVVVWLERDLSTGTSDLKVGWQDEVRTIVATRQAPLVAVVSGSDRPELAYALPSDGGWSVALWGWDVGDRGAVQRADTLAGLDAAREGSEVRLAWLQGRVERVFGRVEADFRAYLAAWPDGADAPDDVVDLGAARFEDERDRTRIGGPQANEVAFVRRDGALVAVDLSGAERVLGRGSPIGWLSGRWTWWIEDRVRRESPSTGAGEAPGRPETVLRLPGAPQRIEATESGGVVGLVWSSGRYLGGLEIWGVDDARSYRSGPLERFALSMGWDPWQIWTAAGGHLLLALLAALIGSMAFAPLWWLGASLLARRRTTSALAITLEGAGLGIVSLLAVAVPVAVRVERLGGPGAALLIDPAWLAAGTVLGVAVALATLLRRDLEATFGRLLGAFVAGSTLITIVAFGTLSAWQRLIAQVA